MKSVLTKIGIVALIAVVLFSLGFVIKMQWDAKNRQDHMNQQLVEMKELQDGIVRSQSRYVSRDDLERLAKDMDLNLEAIQKDLDGFGAEITGLSTILAKSVGWSGNNLPSTGTRPKDPGDTTQGPICSDGTPCPDPYGYMDREQLFSLYERFHNGERVPFGTVGFSAWKEEPWSAEVHSRNYRVNTVLGQDEDGRHYVHNKMQVDVNGESHTIPISQAELTEVYPESRFRVDPHLHLGVDGGASIATSLDPGDPRAQGEFIPNLQVSVFSYGKTRVNPDWTFLGVGLGFETQRKSLGFVVSPVSYNVGKHIPLMDNLHIRPVVGVDIKGNVFVGGGIGVQL